MCGWKESWMCGERALGERVMCVYLYVREGIHMYICV